MINLNGAPKSGTHALIKAVELLGIPVDGKAAMMHRDPTAMAGSNAVFIYRHPKNALISAVRQDRDSVVTPGFLITAMADWASQWLAYTGYLTDPDVLAIRLEDLIANETTHQAIAAHIGVPYITDAHVNLPGMTYSWNVTPSDWTTSEHWTAQVQQAWLYNSGLEIEQAFGYV